jgi:hypothetical protein
MNSPCRLLFSVTCPLGRPTSIAVGKVRPCLHLPLALSPFRPFLGIARLDSLIMPRLIDYHGTIELPQC